MVRRFFDWLLPRLGVAFPLAILLALFVKTAGSVGSFEATKLIEAHKAVAADAPPALTAFGVLAFVLTSVVGFFATAGAAGVDICASNRNKGDVSTGGMVGIVGHLQITDDVYLTGKTMVTHSITKPGLYSGQLPFDEARRFRRNSARFRQLDELARRVRALENGAGSAVEDEHDGKGS